MVLLMWEDLHDLVKLVSVNGRSDSLQVVLRIFGKVSPHYDLSRVYVFVIGQVDIVSIFI